MEPIETPFPALTKHSGQGFLGFLHLANSGIYTLLWPDIFHKLSRRVAQAMNHHSCAELKAILKSCMKMFRFSRAPYNTGRFGQQIAEARQSLLQAMRAGDAEDLIDMWVSGVAKDRGIEIDAFTKHDLIELIEKCARSLSKPKSSSIVNCIWFDFFYLCEWVFGCLAAMQFYDYTFSINYVLFLSGTSLTKIT